MKTAAELVAFEERIRAKWEAGKLPFLIHLSGGNEEQLIELWRDIRPGDWVFSTHRNHYHALLAGVPEEKLERLIDEGHSMFVFDRESRFVTSAILAGTCCIAAGVAWSIKARGGSEKVWCFLGDGAEDQGHAYEAIRYATGHDLPIAFVIEDNDRQVDTSHAERWGTSDRFPWMFAAGGPYVGPSPKVRRYHYAPRFPHAGSGCAHKIAFDPAIVERFR